MKLIKSLVLGSSSPGRASVLRKLNIPFECVSPDIDETPRRDEVAPELVQRLSLEKAQAVAKKCPQSVIIASDQVGVIGGKICGKPKTHQRAVSFLQQSSGKVLFFYTGLCVYDASHHTYQLALDTVEVKVRKLSTGAIEYYLQSEKPYQCAGGFQVEGYGISLFEFIRSEDPNTLIGLPLIKTVTLLKQYEECE